MQALDLLEKRIDSLSRMVGPLPESGETASEQSSRSGTENIVDSLLSAHDMLNEATKEREYINKAVKRSAELEKYLDPNFVEDNQQVRSKEVYLNAIAPELHEQFMQLEQIKQLEPTLGAEYFRNIPGERTEKLKNVAEDNSEFAQQAELIEESLLLAMKRYGEIQTGLLESLDRMNKRLDAVEDKLQQKKRAELEKDLPMESE